jgi:hypothetical protein
MFCNEIFVFFWQGKFFITNMGEDEIRLPALYVKEVLTHFGQYWRKRTKIILKKLLFKNSNVYTQKGDTSYDFDNKNRCWS